MSNTRAKYIKWLADKTGRTELTKEATAPPAPAPQSAQDYEYDAAEEPYVPIGLGGLMATTEKLLAVNKGLADTDFRDSQYFKKHFEPDRQIWERIRTDIGNPRKKLLRMVSARKNLSALVPFYFDDYTEKHITGNPLVSPLEEINPIHLTENQYRITGMGPGGIQSEDSITSEMNAVHPSQFGFIDAVAGPECWSEATNYQVLTKRGFVSWIDVLDDDLFACRINGRLEYHKATHIVRQTYKGPMIEAESGTFKMCVTPNHRILYKRDHKGPERIDTAEVVYGRGTTIIPITSLPMLGDENITHYNLPLVTLPYNTTRTSLGPFEIGDWCEFMGWWLSEGSSGVKGRPGHAGKICGNSYVNITQCPIANPVEHRRIHELLLKMGIWTERRTNTPGRNFQIPHPQLVSYFSMYKNGCYDKFIPEELFNAPVDARRRLLEALLLGDGRTPRNRKCYCTVSRRLAESVLRLATELGLPSFIREEPDKREHVKTTNWVVSIHQSNFKQLRGMKLTTKLGSTYGDNWSKIQYDGMVYCATVPGGLLLVRGAENHVGFWSGNSGKAGVDVRMNWGARMGSNGRIYQVFKNRKTGKNEWKAPHELDGYNLKLPD
jgi:hypothetical protein